MNYLRRVLAFLKNANVEKPTEDNKLPDGMGLDINRIIGTTKDLRQRLKDLEEVPPLFQEIHITSDRTWTLFKEQFDDETGCTKYKPKENFKVDMRLPYTRTPDKPIKEAVTAAQKSALKQLRDYRTQSRSIGFVEKEYMPKSLADIPGQPVRPRYKVYIGSGYGGPSGEIVYNDLWRGTSLRYMVPEGNTNHNIHLEGGTFLELQKATRLRRIFEAKKPKTNVNHVGIELEFISKFDKYQLAQYLLKEDVQEYVHLLDDGSLRKEKDFPWMHEITILAPEDIVYVVLESVLKAINTDGGSKVNWRCGVHVHLDMRSRDRKKAFHNLQKAQRIMYAMNPKSRVDGTTSKGDKDDCYSRRVEIEDLDAMFEQVNQDTQRDERLSRYYGINVKALDKHGTLEVRIHSGSINFQKVSNWVKILVAIVNTDKYVQTEAAKVETFCEHYKLDGVIAEYINERIAKFKDKNGKHMTVDECA